MSLVRMSNVLDKQKRHDVVALGRLGWSLRRIEAGTGVRRETVGEYLRTAGFPVRGRGRRSEAQANPAISPAEVSTELPPKRAIVSGVSTDSAPAHAPSVSACAIYREVITDALARGRNAMLGGSLGRHAHPRHDETPSRPHLCRRAPALGPLPLEPFRHYRFGVRTVHLDGCVEVEARPQPVLGLLAQRP